MVRCFALVDGEVAPDTQRGTERHREAQRGSWFALVDGEVTPVRRVVVPVVPVGRREGAVPAPRANGCVTHGRREGHTHTHTHTDTHTHTHTHREREREALLIDWRSTMHPTRRSA